MILLFIVYFIFCTGGLTLFKIGTNAEPIAWIQRLIGLKLSWLSIGGLLCYGVSFLTYLTLVGKTDLSILYPIATGVSCILIMIVSALFLHESVNPLNWIGAFIIIEGIIRVNYGGR